MANVIVRNSSGRIIHAQSYAIAGTRQMRMVSTKTSGIVASTKSQLDDSHYPVGLRAMILSDEAKGHLAEMMARPPKEYGVQGRRAEPVSASEVLRSLKK